MLIWLPNNFLKIFLKYLEKRIKKPLEIFSKGIKEILTYLEKLLTILEMIMKRHGKNVEMNSKIISKSLF